MTSESPIELTLELFAERVGERFVVELEQLEGIELKLAQANELAGESTAREPFSVVFLGPSEPILPQAIYTVMNERLGPIDLFLVPIGPDRESDGIQYEAVFS